MYLWEEIRNPSIQMVSEYGRAAPKTIKEKEGPGTTTNAAPLSSPNSNSNVDKKYSVRAKEYDRELGLQHIKNNIIIIRDSRGNSGLKRMASGRGYMCY